MNKYITKSGQNLYDVALAIYGSIEGIFDLLVSNSDISFETVFAKGMELSYHNDFILNSNVVNWMQEHNVTIKNGNCKIHNTDIKKEIKTWIKETNSQKFSVNADISDGATLIGKPNLWKDNEDTSLASEVSSLPTGIMSPSANTVSQIPIWGSQQLTASSIKGDWINGVKHHFTINIDNISKDAQKILFDKWYLQGMIILPSDKDELDAYYNNAATPKIKIVQSGNHSAFNVQIPANHFIAIDWGDDSNIEFFHYQQVTTRIAHTYGDDKNHVILIYGHNEFTNLDFTEINGVYYALTNIYVSGQFITPYASIDTLNKLFIIQSNE